MLRHMSNAPTWLFLLVVTCASIPAVVFADGPSEKGQARQLIELGSAALERKDFSTALDYFQRAFSVVPSPNLRFNIAVALEKLGRDQEAATEFERFLLEAAGSQPSAQAYARTQIGILESKLARLTIRSSPGALIEIDGKELGTAPLDHSVRLSPGVRTVVAKKGGRIAKSELQLAAGERREIALIFSAPPTEKWIRRHRASLAFGAADLGVLAASASLGIASLVLNQQLGCHSACPESERGRFETMRSLSIASDVLLGVGIIGAVATVIVYYQENHHSKLSASTPIFAPNALSWQF